MTGTLSSSLTGRTDPRVTTMPTTRSRSSRGRAGPWPAAPAPGSGSLGTARMVSTLPTRRPIMAAPRWSTAISPARSAAGSRPASTFGTSTSCPNRPSTGARVFRTPRAHGRHGRAAPGSGQPPVPLHRRQAAGRAHRSTRPARRGMARRAHQRPWRPSGNAGRRSAVRDAPAAAASTAPPATATSSTSTAQPRHRARSSWAAR